MPVIQVNVADVLSLAQTLDRMYFKLKQSDPINHIVIMIHGFKFDPNHPTEAPEATLFSQSAIPKTFKTISWSNELQINAHDRLGIGFSWAARSTLKSAYQAAFQAGKSLAKLIQTVRQAHPQAEIHIFAHSLGVRVALGALHYLKNGDVTRMAFLYGAEYRAPFNAALNTRAGQNVEILNITSFENKAFDAIFHLLGMGGCHSGPACGLFVPQQENVATLNISKSIILRRLADQGITISAPNTPLCHWSAYTRSGIFDLYRAWFFEQSRLSLNKLQAISNRSKSDQIPRIAHGAMV